MTVSEWLATRRPAPPPELAAAIARAIPESETRGESPREDLIAAARSLASGVTSHGCSDRSHAIDLLALDAIITYAMEAGIENAGECEAGAAALLSGIGDAAAGA